MINNLNGIATLVIDALHEYSILVYDFHNANNTYEYLESDLDQFDSGCEKDMIATYKKVVGKYIECFGWDRLNSFLSMRK